MYIALYRKWRPKKFEEICGQEHITITLRNQIKSEKVSHAYLFCGTRGTGKTTTAKLLAKAVNCFNPIDGNPCDSCPSCKGIEDESSIDVFEIDAASNRGIDDMRDLRESVKFTPSVGKYKVYIIDEVHMLTKEAFNALLKTLEEPPTYVIFILATTEPHKLPATILSRCQRFDFKRVSQDAMLKRLEYIAKQEDIEIGELALRLIIRNSDGAMRDAIGLMDQCSIYGNKKVTTEDVASVLGIVDDKYLFAISEAILLEDVPRVINILGEIIEEGKDITQLSRDLLLHYRNLLMAKLIHNPDDVIDLSQETIATLKAHSERYTKENIIRCINILSGLTSEIKWLSQPKVNLEISLIKMCRLEKDMSNEGILSRIAKLEKILSEGEISITSTQLSQDQHSIMEEDDKESKEPFEVIDEIKDQDINEKIDEEEKKQEKAITSQEKQDEKSDINHRIIKEWDSFIEEFKKRKRMALRTHLSLCKPRISDGENIILCFDKGAGTFSKEAMERQKTKEEIEKIAEEYFGVPLKIKSVFDDEIEGDYDCDGFSSPSQNGENEVDPDEEKYVVDKAIEVFGVDLVEIVEE